MNHNDNPTSTLCENKKLLKLKLATQANPAQHLSCPQWPLQSPLQLSTKGGNNEKNTNINYKLLTINRGKNYTPKNTTVQISMFPHLQKMLKTFHATGESVEDGADGADADPEGAEGELVFGAT